MRGVEIRVTFWVDATGKVVRVAIDPPIRDRKYRDEFTESMLSYRFHPALGPDGVPISATTTLVVTIF
ncbi:MAG TPA: hypothetical protein VMG41_00200 [Gemmatimonadales bacterium]|nr:hypothetical protein [Gemmatimonadales bacterium]